ncbi:YraN family protein [Bacteroides sp. 519]|uniref:YraN family protein n=1 Tax=Bacteroides sp. 519 TaxID=2302937 RepID=UPI0013D1207C|nr:YraN family protein [Bacteroides sp. 519]NDV58913.1 endonuclease [Bacteroides sp. 519]
MAEHNELGEAGENAAVSYLEDNGYVIRHRNWHRGHLELDIVAAKDNELVIVEVKTRQNTNYSLPQDAVNMQKVKKIVQATDAYIKIFRIDAPVRFDIISVVGQEGNFKIDHIEEAFYPPMF